MICCRKNWWGDWGMGWCVDMGAKVVPGMGRYEVGSLRAWGLGSSYWIGVPMKCRVEGTTVCSKIQLWRDWAMSRCIELGAKFVVDLIVCGGKRG